jgi:Rubrerythrin
VPDAGDSQGEPMNDVIAESLCYRLSDEAERVRWRMEDIPWAEIDRERAGPDLRALVREIAFSELTTTTATRRFLTELGDDPDFTQWISVWFYEETKHPQVLLRWLHHVGVTVDDKFLLRGRATAPFMKSRMGTLVTNVISEIVASSAYRHLQAHSSEPVLARIAKQLAADEARHAASFYAYAERHLERSTERDADRRDALKVLHLWFQHNEQVTHPVNEFYARNQGAMPELAFERIPRDRIIRLIGTLVKLPLTEHSDLLACVRDLGNKGQHHETT